MAKTKSIYISTKSVMKNIKEKLKKNELALGSWITLAHPAIAEIMAKAGFDWLAVDLEHSVSLQYERRKS